MTLGLFGGDLSALIRRIVQEELTRPVKGLTPGIYTSPDITIDAAGRLRHIEAGSGGGGGGGFLTREGFSVWWDSSNTVSNNSWTTVSWNFADYDDGYISGGSLPGSDFVLAGNSLWLLSFIVRWSDSGSAMRGIRMRATIGVTTYTVIQDVRTIVSGATEAHYAFSAIVPALGTEFTNGSCLIQAYQNTGSSQDVDINFVGQQLVASPLTP